MKEIKRGHREIQNGKADVTGFWPKRIMGQIIMVIFFVSLNVGHAQYKLIAELYYLSMQSPKETDQLIEDNQELFDTRFFSHLAEVREMAGINGTNNGKYCDAIIDHKRQAECRQQNWAVGIYFWTLSIEQSIVEQTPWELTISGKAAVYGRQLCEPLGTCALPEGVSKEVAKSLVIY